MVMLFNSDDTKLIEMTVRVVQTFMLVLPIVGVQIISSGFFQAIGKPKQATVITLSRQLLVLIPLILVLPRFFGIYGIFYSMPISDTISGIISGIWVTYQLRNLEKEAPPEQLVSLQGLSEEEAEERLAAAEVSAADVPPVV